MPTHKTSKAHYEKYAQMAKDAHVKFTSVPFGYSIAEIERLHSSDPNLNNIPLHKWDALVYGYWAYNKRGIVKSLAEGVCMYKHLAIYQLLDAQPIFTDNGG